MKSTTIGIDLAKRVFQVSTADGARHITKRQRLTRPQFEKFIATTPATQLVMEGCSSAHHWGRLAQRHGHQVKLLHPLYVRPYVRRNKTDAADALVRAAADPDLKPIAVKSEHQQALQSLHRIRAQWQRSRVARINEARALLAAKRARAREKTLTELQCWALQTEARVGHNKAAVALANKMARILWAVWTRHSVFDGNHAKRYHCNPSTHCDQKPMNTTLTPYRSQGR